MRYLNVTPVLVTGIACAVAAPAAAALAYRVRGRVTAARVVLWVLLFGGIAGVLVVTLGPVNAVASVPGAPEGVSNLVPLRDIRSMWRSGNVELVALNLAGNVVLFVPLGLLVGLIARRWWVGALAGAATSVLVEVLQHSLGRSVDVDDVLLNLIGAVAGAVLSVSVIRRWPVLAAHHPEKAASGASGRPGASRPRGDPRPSD